ncbi:protein translocase subunit SecF [Brachybacterium sacelli]|uniref:Protein-export membrane protein SecF n=1 Tax=Brachybacterium sacelli TaxID=173364 RepID=A0ABS4X4F6_9MICO|nr:protein translocase subunit SecF [Brachybacterium sacelli]MBP2382599.1 preprotein translocase subunit SecF [Brachybacterium sacelli]
MTATFSRFGNDLHAGRRTVPLVGRRRTWYVISLVALLVLAGFAVLRGPNLGIEFTGGSEFQVAGVATAEESTARDVVREHVPDNEPKVTVIGQDTMRVQTEQLDSAETAALAGDLAEAYGVSTDDVSSSFVGPVWSGDITQKMLRGIVVFLVLVAATMAVYFRNLKASAAAMGALVHDMLVTAAVYGVVGFEITPGTVIGFLTVMGYSLYDTIVVFDKVRENTADLTGQTRATYADQVELAANQTLVRSINTSVVALLPVGSILAIGAFLLGAGTLKDISLALFIGILVGAYSSIFLAPGFLVDLRRRETGIRAHTESVRQARRSGGASGVAGDRRVDRSDEAAEDELGGEGEEPAEPVQDDSTAASDATATSDAGPAADAAAAPEPESSPPEETASGEELDRAATDGADAAAPKDDLDAERTTDDDFPAGREEATGEDEDRSEEDRSRAPTGASGHARHQPRRTSRRRRTGRGEASQ